MLTDRRAASATCPSRTRTQVKPTPPSCFCVDLQPVKLRHLPSFPRMPRGHSVQLPVTAIGRSQNRQAAGGHVQQRRPRHPAGEGRYRWFLSEMCRTVLLGHKPSHSSVVRPLQVGRLSLCVFVSTDGGIPFLWLRLFPTGQGHVCEERILPEGQSHLSTPVYVPSR